MAVKIIKDFPPNIHEVRQHLNPDREAIYAWGNTIYNPSGLEIHEDVLYHENVHSLQQAETSPQLWWMKYLYDINFRLDQELEAYAKQFLFLKKHFPTKVHKEIIHNFAEILERMYNLGITIYQAETELRFAIKKYG